MHKAILIIEGAAFCVSGIVSIISLVHNSRHWKEQAKITGEAAGKEYAKTIYELKNAKANSKEVVAEAN